MTLYDLRDNLNDAIEEGLGPHKLKDNFSVYDYLEDNTFDELARIGNKYMLDFNIQPNICSTTKTIRYALSFERLGNIGWLKKQWFFGNCCWLWRHSRRSCRKLL